MANKCNISIFLAAMLCMSFAYADDVTAQDLWLQSTANTRTAVQGINDQIMAQQTQQQASQQQQMQQALETLQSQQKATINNQTAPAPSTFQAQPSTVTGTTNPWLKPNPWQNTQQNPYSGQQYGTTPASPSTGTSTTNSTTTTGTINTGTSTPNIPITTSPTDNTGSIYLNPSNQPAQQPNASPINIYK